MAIRKRVQVMKEYKREERTINKQRQTKMKEHQEALKVKK